MADERILKAGGPGALAIWRREMERKGEDWRGEVMEAFKDVIPELMADIGGLGVWPPLMVDAIREHYSLGEDIPIKASVSGHFTDKLRYEVDAWVQFREGTIPLYSHRVGEEGFNLVKWADEISYRNMLRVYLRMALRVGDHGPIESIQSGVGKHFETATFDNILVLHGVYAHRFIGEMRLGSIDPETIGMSQSFEMPLEYWRDSRKAASFLAERLIVRSV